MSKNLSQAAAKEFDSMVLQAYQGRGGKIRPTIQQRRGVVGDVYNFRLMGRGLATEKTTSQNIVTPMNIAYNLKPAPLKNYNAAEYTDIFDQAAVNFDEKQALAESIALAIKRREDQIIIDAMNAAVLETGFVLGANTSSNADGSLSVASILKAGEILNNTYSDGEKYMLISPAMRTALLQDAKTTQSLYVDVKSLITGELLEFAGFKFIYVESNRDEGGLPTATTAGNGYAAGDRFAFAYVSNAVGIAVGIDMRVEVSYVPERTSWLTNGVFKAGAVVIDPQGLVKIACHNG